MTAFLLLVAVLLGARQAQQSPTFVASVSGVTLDVSVSDRGRYIAGLTAKDFELEDNGVRQEILSVTEEAGPLDIDIVVDVSESVRLKLGRRLSAMAETIAASLERDDRVGTWSVGAVITRNGGESPTKTGIWGGGALGGDGGTVLHDGILRVAMRQGAPGYRRVVLALTDGRDSSSVVPERRRHEVIRRSGATLVLGVNAANVPTGLQFHRPAGSGALNTPLALPTTTLTVNYEVILRRMAAESGGVYLDLARGDEALHALMETLRALRTKYLVRYRPAGPIAPGWHDVVVRIRDRSYRVHVRPGYHAGSARRPPA